MVRAMGLEPTCTITLQCTAYKAAEIRSYTFYICKITLFKENDNQNN